MNVERVGAAAPSDAVSATPIEYDAPMRSNLARVFGERDATEYRADRSTGFQEMSRETRMACLALARQT